MASEIHRISQSETLQNLPQMRQLINIPAPISTGLSELYDFTNKFNAQFYDFVERYELEKRAQREGFFKWTQMTESTKQSMEFFIQSNFGKTQEMEKAYKEQGDQLRAELLLTQESLQESEQRVERKLEELRKESRQQVNNQLTDYQQQLASLRESITLLQKNKLSRSQIKEELLGALTDQEFNSLMRENLYIRELAKSLKQVESKFDSRAVEAAASTEALSKRTEAAESFLISLNSKQQGMQKRIDEVGSQLENQAISLNKHSQDLHRLLFSSSEQFLKQLQSELTDVQKAVRIVESRLDSRCDILNAKNEALERTSNEAQEIALKQITEHENILKQHFLSINDLNKEGAEVNEVLDAFRETIEQYAQDFEHMRENFVKWQRSQINNIDKYNEFQNQKEFLREERGAAQGSPRSYDKTESRLAQRINSMLNKLGRHKLLTDASTISPHSTVQGAEIHHRKKRTTKYFNESASQIDMARTHGSQGDVTDNEQSFFHATGMNVNKDASYTDIEEKRSATAKKFDALFGNLRKGAIRKNKQQLEQESKSMSEFEQRQTKQRLQAKQKNQEPQKQVYIFQPVYLQDQAVNSTTANSTTPKQTSYLQHSQPQTALARKNRPLQSLHQPASAQQLQKSRTAQGTTALQSENFERNDTLQYADQQHPQSLDRSLAEQQTPAAIEMTLNIDDSYQLMPSQQIANETPLDATPPFENEKLKNNIQSMHVKNYHFKPLGSAQTPDKESRGQKKSQIELLLELTANNRQHGGTQQQQSRQKSLNQSPNSRPSVLHQRQSKQKLL